MKSIDSSAEQPDFPPLSEIFSKIRRPHVAVRTPEEKRAYEVRREIELLIISRRKHAGAELVTRLHEGEDTHHVMAAITGGLVNKRVDSAGLCLSFAEMCFQRRRLDIFRAVYEAGPPQWLKDIPDIVVDPNEREDLAWELRQMQYTMLGFHLPRLDSPQDWLHTLTSFQVQEGAEFNSMPLCLVAISKVMSASVDFLEYAIEADPKTPLDLVAARHPELLAEVRARQMRRQLEAAQASQSAEMAPATPRVPRRAGL